MVPASHLVLDGVFANRKSSLANAKSSHSETCRVTVTDFPEARGLARHDFSAGH